MELPQGKTIFSGIQPSGTLHIGNYLGALKQWVALQEGNTAYYCIVDEHAITMPYEPSELPERVLNAAAMYIAAGVDPKTQHDFCAVARAGTYRIGMAAGASTPMGELNRMTQYKDKLAKQKDEGTLGLFAYPVLMAADILLYRADTVPVGDDQTQHLELTRNIAERFNNRFGEVFVVPSALVNKETARVMSLADPSRKMSKSDGEKSVCGAD